MNRSISAPTATLLPIRVAVTVAAMLVGSGVALAEEWTPVELAFENFDDALISGAIDSAYVVANDDGSTELVVNYVITNRSESALDMVGIAMVVRSEEGAVSAGAEYIDYTKLEVGETRVVTRSFKEDEVGTSFDLTMTGALRGTSGRTFNSSSQPCNPPIRSEAEFCDGWALHCEMQCSNPLTYATGVSSMSCGCTRAFINGCWTYQCQATCVCQYHGIDFDPPDWNFEEFTEFDQGTPWPENVIPAGVEAGYPLDLP